MADKSKKMDMTGAKAPVVKEDKVVKEEILKTSKAEIKEPEVKKEVIPKEFKEPVEEVVVAKNPKACKKCPITYGHASCNSCVEYKK